MFRYIIQPGDSLYFIALKFGTSPKTIMEANMITEPRQIYPGQMIYIPFDKAWGKNGEGPPQLQRGSRGAFVTLVQNQLSRLGFYTGPIDGFLGPITESGIIQFQLSRSLHPTGIVNKNTWNKLLEEEKTSLQAPPFRARMMLAGLLVIVSISQHNYKPGDTIAISLFKLNLSNRAITLHYHSGQRYDFKITYPSGRTLWRWSESRSFIQALGSVILEPNNSVLYTESFELPSNTRFGLYQAFGWNTAKEVQHLKLTLPFYVTTGGI